MLKFLLLLSTPLASSSLPSRAELAAALLSGEPSNSGMQPLDGFTGLLRSSQGAASPPRLCPPGFWCDAAGASHPCPPGFANPSPGGSSPSACSAPCTPGFFCPAGSSSTEATPCGLGFFCAASSGAPQPIGAGWMGLGGVSGWQPSLVRSGRAPCPEGFTCSGSGDSAPCPAGYFGNATGESRPYCAGLCAPGFVCEPGSTAPTAAPCGTSASWICRSTLGPYPVPVAAGFFSTAEDGSVGEESATTRSREAPCEKGSFCLGGVAAACPAGRYGGVDRETSPLCSGECRAGYYCPTGSTSATQRPCGGASVYCPEGSGAPIPVPPGFYSISQQNDYVIRRWVGGGNNSLVTAGALLALSAAPPPPPGSCAAAWAAAAEAAAEAAAAAAAVAAAPGDVSGLDAGVFINTTLAGINASLRIAILPCPPGSWCDGGGERGSGLARPCDGGAWGGGWQATASKCSGLCAAGHYCPPGSAAAAQQRCGSAASYCPPGSPIPVPVSLGFYSTGGRGALGSPDAAAGTLEQLGFLPSLACGTDAEQESDLSLWPSQTAAAVLLASPFYAASQFEYSQQLRAPCGPPAPLREGGPQPHFIVLRARACTGGGVGGLGGERTRSTQAPCPVGSFCSQGSLFLCPAGFFSSQPQQTACETCQPGYSCKLGSGAPVRCDDPTGWCPSAAASPIAVKQGWKSVILSTKGGGGFDGEEACTAGNFCMAGVAQPCTPGWYCATPGLSAPTGLCPSGFYCPIGTATPLPCGAASVYCPAGSHVTSPVPLGYFSTRATLPSAYPTNATNINTTSATLSPLFSSNTTANAIVKCGLGMFCSGGVARQCPGGTWGGEAGLSLPACSGPCAPGHFCPPGSTIPAQYRCGDAFLLLVDAAASLPVQAALAANPTLPDTDGIPITAPEYNAAALRGLFAAFASAVEGVAGGSLLEGGTQGGGGNTPPLGSWVARATLPLRPPAATSGSAAAAALYDAANQLSLSLSLDAKNRLLTIAAVLPASTVLPPSLLLSGQAGGGNLQQPGAILGIPGQPYNFTATLPWRAGLRLLLPDISVPLFSFASTQRALLRGGPASVYCPAGSSWPSPIPQGSFGTTSAAALSALINSTAAIGASLQSPTAAQLLPLPPTYSYNATADIEAALLSNATQDGTQVAEPGGYSAGGVHHPCPGGTFTSATGGVSRVAACQPCPAGFACPLGSALPVPCGPGQYAVGGAAACTTCPGGEAVGGSVDPVDTAEAEFQVLDTGGAGALVGGGAGVDGVLGRPASSGRAACRTERRCCE